MKLSVLTAALMAGAVSLGATAALAHHSPLAVFDISKRTTQKGVFKAVHWTNPHVHFDVEVTTGGKPVLWQFESHGVTFFTRNSVRKRDFESKIGMGVEVLAQPSLNGSPYGFTRIMKFSDGTEFRMSDN